MQSDMDYAEKMYSLFQRFLPGARPKIRGGGGVGGCGGGGCRCVKLKKNTPKHKHFSRHSDQLYYSLYIIYYSAEISD